MGPMMSWLNFRGLGRFPTICNFISVIFFDEESLRGFGHRGVYGSHFFCSVLLVIVVYFHIGVGGGAELCICIAIIIFLYCRHSRQQLDKGKWRMSGLGSFPLYLVVQRLLGQFIDCRLFSLSEFCLTGPLFPIGFCLFYDFLGFSGVYQKEFF